LSTDFLELTYNDTAAAIGQYLLETVGVDVYLALNDKNLALAVEINDHARIVEHIESGIQNSTHLLGLIGERTRGSWWVPFEIGAARQRKKVIGYVILGEVEYVPSYLQIADNIEDDLNLGNWVRQNLSSFIVEELRKSINSLPYPSIPGIPAVRPRSVIFSTTLSEPVNL
jgi:MTH538 TIR-like domain (DUF1863)